jgi:hypothetical protein
MHVECQRLGPQQVIVESRDFKATFQKLGHDRADLALQQHEVAHGHRHVGPHRLERDPPAQRESRPDSHAIKRDLQVRSREAITMNLAADRPGSAEDTIYLGPISALRLGSRNCRRHGSASSKNPQHIHHGSPPWADLPGCSTSRLKSISI